MIFISINRNISIDLVNYNYLGSLACFFVHYSDINMLNRHFVCKSNLKQQKAQLQKTLNFWMVLCCLYTTVYWYITAVHQLFVLQELKSESMRNAWSPKEVLMELGLKLLLRLDPGCYLGWQALIKAEGMKADSKSPALTRGGSQIYAEIIAWCWSVWVDHKITHMNSFTVTINSAIRWQCNTSLGHKEPVKLSWWLIKAHFHTLQVIKGYCKKKTENSRGDSPVIISAFVVKRMLKVIKWGILNDNVTRRLKIHKDK